LSIRIERPLHALLIAAAASYAESDGVILGAALDDRYFQAGLYIQHVPTGLWAMVNYGDLRITNVDPNSATWFVKAGLRERWNALGHTVLYGEYNINDDGAAAQVGNGITASQSQWWGGGIVQEIDAAAMTTWVRWRTFTYDDNTPLEYENLDEISVGTLINF
jgi:hypothetical protein